MKKMNGCSLQCSHNDGLLIKCVFATNRQKYHNFDLYDTKYQVLSIFFLWINIAIGCWTKHLLIEYFFDKLTKRKLKGKNSVNRWIYRCLYTIEWLLLYEWLFFNAIVNVINRLLKSYNKRKMRSSGVAVACFSFSSLFFRSNFFVKEFLLQILTLYFNFVLQFIVEVELLQCKFIEFVLQSPYFSLFYCGYRLWARIDLWCRLAQMRFTWV